MAKLRVVNWNLHGAFIPGRATKEQQARAWHLIASWDADLVLLQEAGRTAIPDWARQEWVVLDAGDKGWGSVVAARAKLQPKALDLGTAHPWVGYLYNYVLVGEIQLPDGSDCWACSVHAVAKEARVLLDEKGFKDALSQEDFDALRRPGSKFEAYVNDLAFGALHRTAGERRFIVGGDWNTCRLMGCWSFFQRAKEAGWHDCHSHKNEERSYLKEGKPFQLDHIFCDQTTAGKLVDCSVRAEPVVHELSDHAPMVTDFEF